MPTRRNFLDLLADLAPFAVFGFHVGFSPYTKVEESFTLHAVWDVLARGFYSGGGTPFASWDHVTFPGAVPRSFLLPAALGILTYPSAAAGVALGAIRTALQVQILVRIVLSSLHAAAFNHLARTVRLRYGTAVRNWFILLSLSQFHIPYYAGRTLPNFMAMPGVLLALSFALRASTGRPVPLDAEEARRSRSLRYRAIGILTFLATNTRVELALLVVPMALAMGLSGRGSFWGCVIAGAIGGIAALALAAPLDWYLWSLALPNASIPTFTENWQFAWPELASLQYNLLQGQSANWGVMPWYHYIANSLPKLCMASLPLVMLGLVLSAADGLGWRLPATLGSAAGWKEVGRKVGDVGRTFEPGVVVLLAGMSCIGHKEWRFIVYIIPVINIEAAIVAAALWRTPSKLRPLLRVGVLGAIAVNVAATAFMIVLSAQNYPGGHAVRALDTIPGISQNARIHFTPGPLQAGASLFTFDHQEQPKSSWPLPALPPVAEPTWQYVKSEDPYLNTPEGAVASGIDYIVTDDPTTHTSARGQTLWVPVASVQGLDGVSRKGLKLRVRTATKMVILGRP